MRGQTPPAADQLRSDCDDLRRSKVRLITRTSSHTTVTVFSRQSNKRKNLLTGMQVRRAYFVCSNTPMLHDKIPVTKITPLRRIHDVALKRWALFTVE